MNRALTMVVLPAVVALSACAAEQPVAETSAPVATVSTAAAGTTTCTYNPSGTPARPVDLPPSTDVPATGTVSMTLSMAAGPVTITMDRAKAPCTVNSFEALVKQGYFDDTTCHRLVNQGIYVLQCGDPTGKGTGGPGYRFPDELTGTETYTAGVVAMANAGEDTNGSQFFIVWQDSTQLSPDYTVFGEVDAASLAVIQSIAAAGVSTTNSPAPAADATIERVSLG